MDGVKGTLTREGGKMNAPKTKVTVLKPGDPRRKPPPDYVPKATLNIEDMRRDIAEERAELDERLQYERKQNP